MISKTSHYVFVVMILSACALTQSNHCNGQEDDPITLVRQYGPNQEMLRRETIEQCRIMLEWKFELHREQLRHIEDLKRRWSNEAEAIDQQLETIQTEVKDTSSTGFINRKTLEELNRKRLNLEVSIKGLEVRLDAGKRDLEQAKQEAENNRSGSTEESLLQRALQNRMEYLDRLQKLQDQAAVSDDQVAAAEISVLEHQLKLEQFQQRVDSKTAIVQQFESEVATTMTEMNSLRHQLDKVHTQLESIDSVVGDFEKLQSRRAFIQEIVERCDAQAAELEIENARDAALRSLVIESLKEKKDD